MRPLQAGLVAFISVMAISAADSTISIDPRGLKVVAEVDPRFQAYNIEMLEITGGRFWKPYKDIRASATESKPGGSGGDPMANLYQYRPPTDLGNARLRRLTAALGPTYVRV